MKIAIYSPYLDTLGGGEKYMMTIAETFGKEEVDVLLDKHLGSIGADELKKKLSDRFNVNLKNTNFIKAPIGEGSNFFPRLFFLKKYDLCFYLTDGSIFYPFARRNILHIQSPLVGQPATSLWGKIKLNGWDLIIYNSHFTKEAAKNNWPLVSQVIYPPVDIAKIKPLKKRRYILSVGRFFGYLKDKKHGVLIRAFKDLYKDNRVDGWSLHLVGSAGEGDRTYLEQLKGLTQGLPVNFYPNLNYDSLIKLYGESSIYWHAAGFKETDPTKMEHFGISTVEAMAGGCIPVVINKGGQPEIVESGKAGFLWNTLTELKELTIQLANNEQLRFQMSKKAILASQKFAKRRFAEKAVNLIHK